MLQAVRRRYRVLFAGLAIVTGAFALTACVAPPPLTVNPQATSLDIPWDLQFTPDNAMLYTERPKGLSVQVGGQSRLIYAPPDLLVASEAGMMSVALDPSYASNRRVYLCFASHHDTGDDVRIARVRVNYAYTEIGYRTDILTGIPINPAGELGRHSGCRLRFGPDGYLWVGTGDAAIGTAPQDPKSLAGKVLRIDTNGNPAPGNMAAPFDPRIQSYGHRNVQGLAFRSDGMAFDVEHGPGCDDEINRLVNGANYGWDPVPRKAGDPAYNEYTSMTDLERYPNAMRAVWSSGCPTVAPSGGTFVNGSNWGTWDGGLVVGLLKGEGLRMFKISPDGTHVETMSAALDDHGRLRTPLQGPDGALYVTTSNGGGSDQIVRLTAAAATSGSG
jgi:glucose/arabinose dehydrogenase